MNFTTLDLNLLKVLDALLREGSTVRAGQRLGLSQPAVSAALGRLRHALGDELFVRAGQGLEPTDYVRGIATDLREELESLESLLTSGASFEPEQATGSFVIAGADFFAELLMPELGQIRSAQVPGMVLHLVDLIPDNAVRGLETGAVDIALAPGSDLASWAESLPLFSSDYAVIARHGHARLAHAGVAAGDTIGLDLFCDLDHVIFSPEGRPAAVGDVALARVGRSRRVVMTQPFFSGVCATVAQSDAVALMPLQLANLMAPRLGLALYRPPMPVPTARLEMIWHRRANANPAHRWLRKQIVEILAPLDAANCHQAASEVSSI